MAGRRKRRFGGTWAGTLEFADEIFAPTRHEAMVELERQSRLPAPAPLPGDGDRGVFGGRITIVVERSE